ncbi:MAG: YncE family protein [Acidobacteria bacterium]|nr:MAG: YncE family protein [Acidobacteriota bacterium]
MQISDIVLGLAAGVGVRLSPDGKTAYYVEWSIGTLCKVEVQTGMVTTVMTGLEYPEDVLVDWDTNEIFVSERTGSVVQVFEREGKRDIAEPGYAPHQLALVKQAGNRFLYVVCYDSGRLIRIDLNSGGALQPIGGGLGHPVGLVIDAAHKFAYVTEQDTGSLTQIELASGAAQKLHTGMVAPFYLAWDKTAAGIFCVQRDPLNRVVNLQLGPPVVMNTVANGLAWRPSGVAPNSNDSLIYVCSDRELEVISFNGVPPIEPGRPPFEIHSIKFNYREHSIPLQNHLTHTPIPVPEFQRGVRNEPACYLAGSLPHIEVVLRQLPAFVPGTYRIGGTGSHGGVRYKDVAPTFNANGLSNPIDFELMWPLPASVERADVSIDWYARLTPGPAKTAAIGSAIHRFYIILARPTAPWTNETPWAAALDLACGWAAGASNVDDATRHITERYNGSGVVSYDTISGSTMYGWTTFNLTEMLERLTGGVGLGEKVNCTDSANTVSTLANLIGCDLWQSRMESHFALNPVIAIGYNVWEVPFGSGFSYHEVPWKGACTQNENIFDGCLKVDADADPTQPPHTPLLPTNMLFGDCSAMNYRKRLCPSTTGGCSACQAQPGTRKRRAVI